MPQNETKIYWRSDTRSPNEILENGFSPREDINISEWWKGCIRIEDNSKYTAPDANLQYCVSLSFNMFSAAIFPINGENSSHRSSYLYAIALPNSYRMNLTNRSLESSHNIVPENLKDVVIDLHTYQTQFSQKIFDGFDSTYFKHEANVLLAGMSLYAYEAMACRINPENIICAIQINRSEEILQRIEGTIKVAIQPTREFILTGNIIENPKFQPEQQLAISHCGKQETVKLNYLKDQQTVLKTLARERNKLLKTPSVGHGLGGKVFRPGNSTFFSQSTSLSQILKLCKPLTDNITMPKSNDNVDQNDKKRNAIR